MDPDTAIGGAAHRFPLTRRSVILAARSAEPAERADALDSLIGAYWKPVYKYIRLRWQRSNEDAKDLTQDFFTTALDKDFFERYDPAKAAFRTYLRTCVDAFAANEHRRAGALKRGGGVQLLPLDFETAEGELRFQEPAATPSPEEMFQREWARAVFQAALDSLRDECNASGKQIWFRVFERYDLEDEASGTKPTYRALADEFGVETTDVTNYLSAMRRGFRRCVLDTLRKSAASERDFRSDALYLLGVEPA